MTLKSILLTAALTTSSLAFAANDPATDNPLLPVGQDPNPALPYDLNYPFAYFELDEILKNISGLSPTNDPNTVASLGSDEGKVYMINKKTGKIASSAFFVTEGDFQSIEFVRDTAFALKSNGQLYKIWNLRGAQKSVKMVKTNFPRTATLSGMTYDIANNRLLISAKGQKEGEFSREIYAYDIKTGQSSPEPVYEITLASFKGFLANKSDKQYLKLREDYVSKASTKGFDFVPSSIAIHPLSGNIYVVSSVNQVLLVMNIQGEILEMTKLKKESHLQPQGICFDEEGTMFIANEAKDGTPAKLYEYKMQKTAITASRR